MVGEIGGGAIRCVVCHDGGQIIRLDNGEALEIAHRLEGIIRCIPRGEILDGQAQRRDGVGGDVFPLVQVHDELVYEIREDKVDQVVPEIKKIMENVMSLADTEGIPLTANALVGNNWGELK